MVRVLCVSALNPDRLQETWLKPLWASFLAAYCEKFFGNKELDFRYGSTPIENEISSFKPDIVCISSVTQNYNYAIKFARYAKQTGLPVVIGGMHISSLPTSLSPDMDVACIGEGEVTFLELVQLFLKKGQFNTHDLVNIEGIAFRDGESIVQTPRRASIESIDAIPHPKRSIVGYSKHNYLYTTRGCAYSCVFCSCHKHWGNVRSASAEYIIEEIKELIDHGVTAIRFADENFVYNKERLQKLAHLILEHNIQTRVKFSCWCRANDVTREVVELLKSINIVSVKFGFESGSDRILNKIKGGVTVQDNHRVINLFRNVGIQVNGDFLYGTPDEIEDDIKATYTFIKKSALNFVDINLFSPLPGTPIWDIALKQNQVSNTSMDWSRCNYKFIRDKKRIIVLSKKFDYEYLLAWHKRFQRIRFVHTLLALPITPWLGELPHIACVKIKNMIVSKFRKIARLSLFFMEKKLIHRSVNSSVT